MGYIKKLKNNELVGGTDKHTIYPVTSTKAVFEEVSENNFQSQKSINVDRLQRIETLEAHDENHEGRVSTLEEHDSDHESRVQELEDTMPDTVKSITINGSTKTYTVDDKGNVDLTVYTVDSDPEMPDIADKVEDLRNMVGTSTPVLETSHKTRIETLEGGDSVTGSVENKIKTKVDTINSSFQDDNNEYVKYSMTQTSGKVTDFNIDETSLKNAITSLNSSISGDNIVIRSGSTPSGTGEAGKIYRYVNSSNNTYTDYMYSGGNWVPLATHDTSNEQAQVAYYTCTATGSGAQATKQFVSNGSLEYTPSSGGHIKILMGEANTATGTIYLKFGTTSATDSTKKPLYYNGEPASASNTWEAGETVEVYYDGTNYYANNVAGGGGGDGVFDVSEKYPTSGVEGGNTYTLDGALAVLNANLPASKKKGGMSIKFVQSSDNKYVQYRLMSDSFGTIESDWQNIGLVQQTGLSETVAMSQKAVTEKFNIISNSIELLNNKDKGKITWSDFSFTAGAIASDGSYLNHRAFDIAYIYLHDMEVGKLSLHIKASTRAADTTAIIGFYSSEEVSKETLLSLVDRKNTQGQFEDYDVLIPNGTKMIAVNYFKQLFTDEEIAKQITASITYTKNGYIRQYVASVCQGMTKNNYILYNDGLSHFIALNWGYTKVVTDGKGYDSVLVYEENIPNNYALVTFYSDIETMSKDTYLKKYSVAGTETKGWREVNIPSEAKLMCIEYAKDEEVKNLPGIILIKDGEKASNVIFENNAEYKDAQSAIEGALVKADEAMEKVVVPVQQRGTSATEVMSQNAVSHELDLIETSLAGIGKRIDEIKPVTGNVTNNPDNEYITAKDEKLTFADKFFDRSQFSGYGRVYVRKNIKEVKDYTEEEIKLSDNKFYICTKSINGQNVAFESGDNCFTNGQIPSVEGGNFRSVALKVTNNDIFSIQNTGSGRCRAWMLYDDDGTVLAVADDNINSVNAPYELVVAQHIQGTTANLIINHSLIGNAYRKPYVVKRRYTEATHSANILTGIEYPNTIYHIQYDFDLNGRLLALPKNSILIFEGGSIKNGDIVGNLSEMVSNLTPIYGERLNLYGTWTTSTFYPEWFGAIGDGISDDTAAIQRVLDLGDQVKMRAQICCFLTSKYLITSGLRINGGTTLRGLYKSSLIGHNKPESSILICQFANTKQWALQSNNYGNFDSTQGTFYEGQLFPYNALVGRNAYDHEWLKSQTGIRIENICITAKKTGEAYIFGGVRLMVGESSMHDVGIFGFWIGYARSCSWFSTDDNMHVSAKYIACYIGSDMNGFHLRDSYLTCKGGLNEGDVTEDYQFAGTSESKSVSVYAVYARGIVENVISESADYARNYSSAIITEIHSYFEAIKTAVYKVSSSEVTIVKGTNYSSGTKLGIINSSTFTWLGEWWHSYGWDITNSSVQFIGGAHSVGDSADREEYGAYLPSQCVGQTYYDTTLGKVLYWSGNGWKDAIGNSVE